MELGVGVIGAGIIGTKWARKSKEHPKLKVLGISDVIKEKAEKVANEVGAKAYTDFRKMLKDEEGIDIVFVATPDHLHREPVIAAAEAGKHLWIEKPLATNIDDAKEMMKAIEKAQKKGAKVIIESRKGYGRAYKTGLKEADGDIIVTGDADGTYPFDKVHEYIDLMLKENLDFITTNRFAGLSKKAMSFKHKIGNLILSLTLRLLYGINIKDSQSGMWIIRKKALEKIKPLEEFHDGMPFSEEIKIEMFINKKIKSKEIPSCLYRRKGVAKLQSWKDGWRNLRFLIKYRVSR